MAAAQVIDRIVTDRAFLSQRSKETTLEEMKKLGIVSRLICMLDSGWTPGIGLAAIQIGVPIRVAVYIPNRISPELSKDPVTLINPEIVSFENLNFKSREGCLSLPDKRFNTYRYGKIVYENGEMPKGAHLFPEAEPDQRPALLAEGVEAQVVQHEIDHMDGRLCDSRTLIQTRNERCACGSNLKFKKCHGK